MRTRSGWSSTNFPRARGRVAGPLARVRSPRGSWTSSAASRRARSTSRSPPSSTSRPAPSAAICTTCTASSVRWTAPTRSSWQPSRAGSSKASSRAGPPSIGRGRPAYPDQEGGDCHADRIDADIARRPLAPADKGLVELVRAGVDERDADGPEQWPLDHASQRPPPGSGQQCVAGDVAELAEHDHPPGVVPARRLRGEIEDHAHQDECRDEPDQGAPIQRPAAWSGKSHVVISVTSKSRYAVVALAELARAGDSPMPTGQVAERRGIPVQFLEQLFSTLRRAGILVSHRGAKGGYTLARPADQINVLEVIQDRKSTRLNSSHMSISYAVFCLKK